MNVQIVYQIKEFSIPNSCLIESRIIIKGNKDNRDKFIEFLRSFDIERFFFYIVEYASSDDYVVFDIVIYLNCINEFRCKILERVNVENVIFDTLS